MRLNIRPAQLAAILVLFCITVLAVVVLFRRSRALDAQQLVACLPREPGAVVHINMRALRDSGILGRLVGSTVTEEPEYRQFVAETGFDYKTDLDQIYLKITPRIKYLVLTGRFDWKNLIRYATRSGGGCHNGFCRVQSSDPKRFISFYALRPNVMALASGSVDEAARAIANGSSEGAMPAIPTQPIWSVIPASSISQFESGPSGTRAFLRALATAENVTATLGPQDSRFELTLDVTCKTAEDAAVLKAQLESVTAVLKRMIAEEKQKPNPADLSGLLTKGNFERQERRVLGRWPVEYAFLDSLAGS